jgi:hypothetical protein
LTTSAQAPRQIEEEVLYAIPSANR